MTDASKTIEYAHQPISESEVASEATQTQTTADLLKALNKIPGGDKQKIAAIEKAFKP